MSVTLEKRALRAKVLAARAGMASGRLLAAADSLFENLVLFLRGYPRSVISCYMPMASEPGGPALPDRLAAAFPESTLLLPVLLPDLDLDWAPYAGPHSLSLTSRRLYEPTTPRLGPEAIATAQIAIVPALATDADGHRLGRGGGSYDRALSRLTAGTVSVALLHAGELLNCVPYEPHDCRVAHSLEP
ncbi:MAG TPA: 5-formyltetrahydrofolate cyclo-ligase [Candidatus Limnocylindrales bacterium]|nr:5-formyltetrahydrofolate cyclo-ligase [Candidatus Limnocylindrales bacterium]